MTNTVPKDSPAVYGKKIWLFVRVVFMIIGAIQGVHASIPEISWWVGVLITSLAGLFLGPVSMISIMALQSVNPMSAERWYKPSWYLNPFRLRDPIQFFHFATWYATVFFIAAIMRNALLGRTVMVFAFMVSMTCIGAFIGLSLCQRIFRNKF